MGEEEDGQRTNIENETDASQQHQLEGSEVDKQVKADQKKIVKFLDSVDCYLTLLDSLSSTLRQGWLELASARHSMGTTRISSTLFDLNCRNAATSVKVTLGDAVSEMKQPNFTLCKWGYYDNQSSSEEPKLDEDELLQSKSIKPQLRHRGTSEIQEKRNESNGSTLTVEDQIQKERSKSLSMFGTLVSPKLRATQFSFENALDALIEIANTRSAMLSAYHEVQKEIESIRS